MKLKLKDLRNKRIHFIGIGGISMSALAQMLHREKIYIQGSDESENSEVAKLKRKRIMVYKNHNAENLKNIDIVVYSSAISEDNEELIFAKNRGLLILKRAELLAAIAEEYSVVISVAGSHGKTTASAMIAEMFIKCGLKPTVHIGGVLKSINSNYKVGNKKYFITESCEYKDNFLYLHPDLSVILNIDSDHLDYFINFDGVKKSFEKFVLNTKSSGLCIYCKDDENLCKIIKNAKSVNFGLNNAIFKAESVKKCDFERYSFDVVFYDVVLGNIKLNIMGKHNIYNALAAVYVGLLCGINFFDIKNAIENFSGTQRRMDFIGDIFGAKVYHDYAHHPRQICEVVKVGKALSEKSGGKLIVVYEPHTFSRTKFLLSEFLECFKGVDKLYLAPVYSARESDSQGYNSKFLCDKLIFNGVDVEQYDSFNEIEEKIKNTVKNNDIIFVLGAGKVEKLAKKIIE